MTKVLFCAIAAMFAFAACGKETAPAPAAAVEEKPAEAQALPQSAAEPREPANELTQPAGGTDGETVEASASTTTPVAAAVAANTPAPPVGELKGWTAGTHFIEYATAQRVAAPPGQIASR